MKADLYEVPSEIDAWFERAKNEACVYAIKEKAPVIGYAWHHDCGSGSGYFRLDKCARFQSGMELSPIACSMNQRANHLKRAITRMQKRGTRAIFYEITETGEIHGG